MMKNQEQLINNIIGQLNGIKRMLDGGQDCLAVLIQLKATKAALGALSSKLVVETLIDCASPKNQQKKLVMEKLIKELTNN